MGDRSRPARRPGAFLVMRRVTLYLACLLVILAAAAGAQGWKWMGHNHTHAIAGWTWDDSNGVWIDATDVEQG